MVVGVCGLGYTGSGAVMDLLSEYDGINVDNKIEFTFSYEPDGLEDLVYDIENPSRFFKCDVAISRFRNKIKSYFKTLMKIWDHDCYSEIENLTDSYINDICQVQWKGMWGYDTHNYGYVKFFFYRIFFFFFRKYPKLLKSINRKIFERTMYLSIKPEGFKERTIKYVEDIFHILGYNISDGVNVFNQLFSGDNPQRSFPLYKESKAIVVDKDPRDLYVLCKREVRFDGSWLPTDNVDDFINYYRAIRTAYSGENEKILHLKFEELIYEYDKTVKRIEEFIGVEASKHVDIYKKFDPQLSINNTQLFRKYRDLSGDIKKIEEKLSEYLYDYKSCPVLTEFGKSF